MPQYLAGRRSQAAPLMLLAILLLGALAACGGNAGPTPNTGQTEESSANGVVNLTMWTWVIGVDKAAAEFTKLHPNIHITVVNVGSGPTEYNKLDTAITANNEPDLAQIEYQYLPTFETTGSLVDLSQYGANAIENQFVPWTWKQVSLGNVVYAIPQDSGPLALYYRADIFQKYHLPVPTT